MAIKCVFMLRRLPHLSREEFLEYWREKHAALARRSGGAMRLQRYVQLHPVAHPIADMVAASRGSALEDFDGITEVWWDSLEDLAAVGSTSEEIAAAILDDESRFVDFSRSTMFFAEENTVIGKPLFPENSPSI